MSAVETERLHLRPWSPDDLDELAAVFAEPEVWRYPFGRGFSQLESEQFLDRQLEHWTANGFGSWAAKLKANGRLIGYIGLSIPSWLPQVLPAVEVGWRLHPDYREEAWRPKGDEPVCGTGSRRWSSTESSESSPRTTLPPEG